MSVRGEGRTATAPRAVIGRARGGTLVMCACGALLLAFAAGGCGGRGEDTMLRTFDPDSIPDAYAPSTAALTWAGATRSFQITREGDVYNGEWAVRIAAAAEGATADPPRVIAFEDRWLPIAHWTRTSGAVRWDFEAVAFPERGKPPHGGDAAAARDSGLLVSLRVNASNRGEAAALATLDLALSPGDSSSAFVAWDAPEEAGAYHWASQPGNDVVHGWASNGATDGSLRRSWTLDPGTSRSESFLIPAYPTAAARLAAWAKVPHAQRAGAVRKAWNDEMARGTRLELGDPQVENALRGALALLLSSRERRGPFWIPIGSPLHYRDVWLRDGARVTTALAVMGRTAEARAFARGFRELQWPQGAFLTQRGQLDGTGQALWAFEQAMLRPPPGPSDSVAHFAESAELAWEWCEWQRGLGRSTGWAFGAMMPAAHPRDNENVRAQLVGNDAWTMAGYRAAARLLRAAGRIATAESVEVSLARYRADFEAGLDRTGSRDIPPSWQGIGRDWGNLTAAWPCGVLPATHPRVQALARRMWNVVGGAGLCAYGHADSLHYYLGADLATTAMLAGERGAADSVLQAMLHWRTASGGACELFSGASRGYGNNPPPHGTSAAALISLVRNALVFDDGDTLRLTMGARATWWRGARVRQAPTRFGTLDLEFERKDDAASWRWTPVDVWAALTLPPGTGLAGDPPSPLVRGPRADVVLAPPRTGSARVNLAR